MHLSFRTKIFVALIALLVPTLALILVSINGTTDTQVEAFTRQSIDRSREAFKEAEDRNRESLTVLGVRFSLSARISALIQEAVTGSLTPEFAAENLRYDLKLANHDSALVAVTDIEGRPLFGVLSSRAMANPQDAVPESLLDSLMVGPDTTVFGYKLIGNRLYSTYMALSRIGTQPAGFLIVGEAIDAAMAEDLGRAVDGEVCFVAAGRCVASTRGLEAARLGTSDMVAATASGRKTVTRDGKRWLLIATPIRGGVGHTVIARPLDALLLPFDDIKRVLLRVSILAVLVAPLFAAFLARTLARPVRVLVAATSRVARGDYTAEVPVESRDELGTLAVAFNDMTHGLLLKEKYRGLLDKVVSPEIADEMLRSKVSLGGENREVTILFADIRGFTPFTEGMEPQQVIAVLNETMERASAVVEREGGVVDKYIGDEIMALFGAPLSHGDDALRAVRAAVGIRDAIQELARERKGRGDAELAVGIGVNTGTVVAGNMGSERRLNYTVLGEAVNVAARLCSAARPHQILIGEATQAMVGDAMELEPAGERTLKGLSRPLSTYAVIGHARALMLCVASAVLMGTFARPAGLAAQRSPLLSYTNASGGLQASLSSRFEITLYAPQEAPAWLLPDTRLFVAPRASLYSEVFAGSSIYGLVEVRGDRGEAPRDRPMQIRIEQAFARFSASPALEIQAGKFPSPFGSYLQRHGTAGDPLIRPPLPYEWPTLVTPSIIPASTSAFTARRDAGAALRPSAAPPIWGVPYQLGAMLFGNVDAVGYRVALMNSAPSSVPREWDRVGDLWNYPSVVGGVGYQMSPALRVGASFNRGPYMRERIDAGAYPAGSDRGDFRQTMYGLDASYAKRLVELRGEVMLNRWAVPNVNGTPTDVSYYVESRIKIAPGAVAAARIARMRFNSLPLELGGRDSGTGAREPWDYPVSRVQLGGGYQVTEAVSLRGEYQWTLKRKPRELADNLFSLQLRIEP